MTVAKKLIRGLDSLIPKDDKKPEPIIPEIVDLAVEVMEPAEDYREGFEAEAVTEAKEFTAEQFKRLGEAADPSIEAMVPHEMIEGDPGLRFAEAMSEGLGKIIEAMRPMIEAAKEANRQMKRAHRAMRNLNRKSKGMRRHSRRFKAMERRGTVVA